MKITHLALVTALLIAVAGCKSESARDPAGSQKAAAKADKPIGLEASLR